MPDVIVNHGPGSNGQQEYDCTCSECTTVKCLCKTDYNTMMAAETTGNFCLVHSLCLVHACRECLPEALWDVAEDAQAAYDAQQQDRIDAWVPKADEVFQRMRLELADRTG